MKRKVEVEAKPELFDVVTYRMSNSEVVGIPGVAMERSTGTFNAERRRDSVMEHINLQVCSVAIVPTGSFPIGSKLPKELVMA